MKSTKPDLKEIVMLKRNILAAAVLASQALATGAHAAPARGAEPAPDALVKAISDEVIATIRQDKALQSGDPAKTAALVETKILPHFDFAHTTRIAMGPNWRRATPEQQERLTSEFRELLVRTYSTALTSYRDQRIEVKPLRARPDDTQVTVRTEIRQPGAQAVAIDYEMEKTADGWKIFDIRIAGASLAATYRDTFAEAVRNRGVDGLIEMLSGKNRQNGARRAAVQT
jgi:phospholipid transport system substrate-binding protein